MSTRTPNSQKAVFYFSHSTALLPLITALGLYKDPGLLTAQNYRTYGVHRAWNISTISPFSGNIGLLLVNCRGQNQVMVFHNERELHLPDCPSNCTWNNFKNVFNRFQKCDQHKICDLPIENANDDIKEDDNLSIGFRQESPTYITFLVGFALYYTF